MQSRSGIYVHGGCVKEENDKLRASASIGIVLTRSTSLAGAEGQNGHLRSSDRVRHTAKHNLYSLGLVLLRIGMWRTLSDTTGEKEGLASERLLECILQKYVPQLDFYVGTRYRTVVARCLRGDIGSRLLHDDQGGANATNLDFLPTIEEQLASCIP